MSGPSSKKDIISALYQARVVINRDQAIDVANALNNDIYANAVNAGLDYLKEHSYHFNASNSRFKYFADQNGFNVRNEPNRLLELQHDNEKEVELQQSINADMG